MAFKTERLTCPCCGFPVQVSDTECPAGHPLNISTFNSVYAMPAPMVNKYANTFRKELADAPDDQGLNYSLGICYLKLKLYDKALAAFENAMEDNFDNSEVFFYAAICLLQGKKPFLHQRPTIDKVLEYMNAALMIEEKGIYFYFLAYVKYDYFTRKYLNHAPNYTELLARANQYGVSHYDAVQLFSILQVEQPSVFSI